MLKLFKLFILTGLLFSFQLKNIEAQQITIEDGTSFHKTVYGQFGALENEPNELGGKLTLIVSNQDPLNSDSIQEVIFRMNDSIVEPVGYRVWPNEMSALGQGNNFSTITVKGDKHPFKEGETLTVEVTTTNGATAKLENYVNYTPKLRLGNLIPDRSMQSLFVYVRNIGEAPKEIQTVYLNEKTYHAGVSQEIQILGGDYTIQPGNNIGILKIEKDAVMYSGQPFAVRLKYQDLDTQEEKWIVAGIRIVEPDFPMGTWNSSGLAPDNPRGTQRLRQIQVNSIMGPGIIQQLKDGKENYFLRTMRFILSTDPSEYQDRIPTIVQDNQEDYTHVWFVHDEPDLSGRPVSDMLLRNQLYWEHGPDKPTYINLALQKRFNRYGWFADIVSMDHYAAPGAPSAIPGTWIPVVGRKGEMKQSLEYTEYLKFNTEPTRVWSWAQLAGSTWNLQPTTYAVNYQFWAHIMGGAKGIHWFVAQTGTASSFPEQWAEGQKLMKQFTGIRNLCLFGEYADIVETSTENVSSRALIGEDAMVIVVVNNNFIFQENLSILNFDTDIEETDYQIEFEIPSWISKDDFYRVVENHRQYDVQLEHIEGNRYRINPDFPVYKDSHVFVIGKKDETAPDKPIGLRKPYVTDSIFTFSWKEPFDNFGVKGYLIRYNGQLVDTARFPIYDVENPAAFNCGDGLWEVIAYDEAGNLSEAATYTIVPEAPFGSEPSVLADPADFIVSEWQVATFEVEAAGDVLNFQWQVSGDNGASWTDLPISAPYTGVNTAVLMIDSVRYTMTGNLYRAVVTGACGPEQTSEAALLEVEPSFVTENKAHFAFYLYPNPTKGLLHFEVQIDQDVVAFYEVFDLTGRKLLESQFETGKIQKLDLKHLPSGVYMLKLNVDGKYAVSRVVLK